MTTEFPSLCVKNRRPCFGQSHGPALVLEMTGVFTALSFPAPMRPRRQRARRTSPEPPAWLTPRAEARRLARSHRRACRIERLRVVDNQVKVPSRATLRSRYFGRRASWLLFLRAPHVPFPVTVIPTMEETHGLLPLLIGNHMQMCIVCLIAGYTSQSSVFLFGPGKQWSIAYECV